MDEKILIQFKIGIVHQLYMDDLLSLAQYEHVRRLLEQDGAKAVYKSTDSV